MKSKFLHFFVFWLNKLYNSTEEFREIPDEELYLIPYASRSNRMASIEERVLRRKSHLFY